MTDVNCSGMPLAQFDRDLRSDLTGPFLTCLRFVRALEGKGSEGRIVSISSIHERAPRARDVDYDSSKGGQPRLTATVTLELAPADGVAPGGILTPNEREGSGGRRLSPKA